MYNVCVHCAHLDILGDIIDKRLLSKVCLHYGASHLQSDRRVETVKRVGDCECSSCIRFVLASKDEIERVYYPSSDFLR